MAALCRLGVRQNPILPILRRAEVAQITAQVGSDWLFVPGVYRGFDFVEMARQATGDRAVRRRRARASSPAIPRSRSPVPIRRSLPAADDPGNDVRWYFYSSGTTAAPKGAKHTDASVMSSSIGQIEYIGLGADDLFAVPFPITHIGGIMLLVSYMRVGARLLLIETFDPASSPQLMAERGATILGSATPFFHAYLAAQRAHGDAPLFTELRNLHAGGAPITPELNAKCLDVFGTRIINQWGLTEFPAATSLAVDDPPEMFDHSVGRMVPGAEVKTVGFDGEIVPSGTEGELWVRGPQRCLGYVESSLDADAFDADGYFRTGDLGIVDERGYVRITGRLKDIIIRNAENLSAQEIENVLIEHPAIADIAVVGVPDERTGERACAVVVLAPGHDSLTHRRPGGALPRQRASPPRRSPSSSRSSTSCRATRWARCSSTCCATRWRRRHDRGHDGRSSASCVIVTPSVPSCWCIDTCVEATSATGLQRPHVVQHPVIGSDRGSEPHRVVEARPTARQPVDLRRQEAGADVGEVGERAAVHQAIVAERFADSQPEGAAELASVVVGDRRRHQPGVCPREVVVERLGSAGLGRRHVVTNRDRVLPAGLVDVERGGEVEDDCAVLHGADTSSGERSPVAVALDLEDHRASALTGTQEVAVHRVRVPPGGHGEAGGTQRLCGDLPAEQRRPPVRREPR